MTARTISILLAVLLFFALVGCGPAYHLKRAELKGAKVTTDTVYKDVTVIVPQVQTDTVVERFTVNDTITVTKDRLQVKVVRLPGEKVYIEGKCLPDTVKITVPVEVTRTIEAGYGVWDVVKWCLFVGAASILLTILFWSRRK